MDSKPKRSYKTPKAKLKYCQGSTPKIALDRPERKNPNDNQLVSYV